MPTTRIVSLAAALVLLVGALAFALLDTRSNEQHQLRRAYTTGARDVGKLIASIFESAQAGSQQAILRRQFGADDLQRQLMRAAAEAVITANGHVLAKVNKLPDDYRQLTADAVAHKIALGPITNHTLPFAISFPAHSGTRVVIEELPASRLTSFFDVVLAKVPLTANADDIVTDSGYIVAVHHEPILHAGERLSESQLRHSFEPVQQHRGFLVVSQPILGTLRFVLFAKLHMVYASLPNIWLQLVLPLLIAGLLGTALVLLLTRSENHRMQLAEEVRTSEQLVIDLEQVAATVSHDVRAPLRRITAFSDLLLQHADEFGDQEYEWLSRINRQAIRLDRLTIDLVEYARNRERTGPRETTNLEVPAQEAIEFIKDAGAEIDVTITTPLPEAIVNPVAIRQVFTQLLSNAAKFHDPSRPCRAVISGEQQNNHAVISVIWVRDYGIGIEPRYRERVFESFKRLHGHDQYEGSGIGLALVKRIVERHGGTIQVVDVADSKGGVCFRMELPT